MNEGIVALLIPIVLFICIAAVFAVRYRYRLAERAAIQETIRGAIDKGHQLTPELVSRLGDVQPKDADLRRGVISITVAIAIALFAFAVGEGEAKAELPLLGIAGFPLLLGIAYLILHRLGSKDRVGAA